MRGGSTVDTCTHEACLVLLLCLFCLEKKNKILSWILYLFLFWSRREILTNEINFCQYHISLKVF